MKNSRNAEVESAILARLAGGDAVTYADVTALGFPRSAAAYAFGRLEARGAVRRVARGKFEAGAAALAPEEVAEKLEALGAELQRIEQGLPAKSWSPFLISLRLSRLHLERAQATAREGGTLRDCIVGAA